MSFYSDKTLSFSPIAYWPLNETSGTNADNAEGTAARDGTYSGVTLNSSTGPDSDAVGLWDGSNDYCDIYSASLDGVFDGAEMTICGWFKVSGAGVWTDSTLREMIRIRATANIYVRRTATDNQIEFRRDATPTSTVTVSSYSPTDWVHFAVTVSEAADEMKAYLDGVQTGSTQTGLGTWTGSLSSTSCCIGSDTTSTDEPWSGYLAHVSVFDSPLSANDITDLYNYTRPVTSGPGTKLAAILFNDSTKTHTLADWSYIIQGLQFETDEHGFGFLSAFVPMTPFEAFRFYSEVTVPHLVVSDGAFAAYEGRVEDISIVDGGIQIGAYGYWRAMFDTPYTSAWTDTRYKEWEIIGEDDSSLRTPAKYYMDNNKRLYISLRQGETYSNNADYGAWYYEVPDNSRKDATRLEYDYDITLPTNWKLIISSFATGFASGVLEATVATGDGTNQTGSNQAEAITASKQIVSFSILNQTGGDYTNTGETDDWYAKITNVRVMGSTGDASNEMHADEIVNDLISAVNALNSTQLDDSTALVADPGVDLQDEVYEDLLPGDIAVRLAELGDGSTPPLRYETGVWEDLQLYFRERGSAAQDWYTELSSLSISGTIDTVFNSVYAIYKDGKNFNRRTADGDDTPSQKRYGITRKTSVEVKTTSSTQAAITRDAILDDSKEITPQGSIFISSITGATGGPFPLYLVRAGDTITVRNLPPIDSSTVDKIRKFTIKRTRYSVDDNILEVIPELDPPSLDVLVANVITQNRFTGPSPGAGFWR